VGHDASAASPPGIYRSIGVFVYRPMDAVFPLHQDAAAGTTAAIVGPAEAEAGALLVKGPLRAGYRTGLSRPRLPDFERAGLGRRG